MIHSPNHKTYTDPRERALNTLANDIKLWPTAGELDGTESSTCPGWVWCSDDDGELRLVRINRDSENITERDWRKKRELVQHVMEMHHCRSPDLDRDQAKRLLAAGLKTWPNKGEELPALPSRMKGWAWDWCGEVMVLKHKWNGMLAMGDYWQAQQDAGLNDPVLGGGTDRDQIEPIHADSLSRFYEAASNVDDDHHKLATNLLQAFEQAAMGSPAQPAT